MEKLECLITMLMRRAVRMDPIGNMAVLHKAIGNSIGVALALGRALATGFGISVTVEVGEHDEEDGRVGADGVRVGFGIVTVDEHELEGVDDHNHKLCLEKKYIFHYKYKSYLITNHVFYQMTCYCIFLLLALWA